jgi:PPM family protein phosphatase
MAALRWGAATDVGRSRSLNEDALVAVAPVFAVADGMGGHAAGEVASQIAVELMGALADTNDVTGDAMVHTVQEANREIYRRSQSDASMRGMGTTVVGLALIGPGGGAASRERLGLVNVGDSRIYMWRNGELSQVSNDHSYVSELVAAGEITPAQARMHPNRNIVTRALGIEPHVEVDLWELPAVAGERFLLCSDGLVDEVSDPTIGDVMGGEPDPQVAADRLVRLANDHGGHDNITVIVVDVINGETHMPPLDTTISSIVPPEDPWHSPATEMIGAVDTVDTKAARKAKAKAKKSGPGALAIARGTTFALALIGIAVVAVGGVRYYGRQGTFVRFQDEQVAVYRGRPGGVLWVSPTLLATYPMRRNQLSLSWQTEVASGLTFTSRQAADRWFEALKNNPSAVTALGESLAATTTTTSTTTTTTTTAPAATETTLVGP